MNSHENARLTPIGRERLVRQVESGQTPEAAARAAGVCPRTVRKWVDWFNNRRLFQPIGNIPPAEAEAAYYASPEPAAWRSTTARCGSSSTPRG